MIQKRWHLKIPDELDKTLLPHKPNVVERQFLKWRFPAHLTLISISFHTFKATAIYLAEDDENIPYLQQAIWLATCQSWFVAQRWVTQRHLIQGETSPPFLGLTWVNPCLCRHLKVWGAGAWGVPLNLIIQHCYRFQNTSTEWCYRALKSPYRVLIYHLFISVEGISSRSLLRPVSCWRGHRYDDICRLWRLLPQDSRGLRGGLHSHLC